MKFIVLATLVMISILMGSSNNAFAGGPEYDNRANIFWLQFYVTVVAIIGIMVAIGVIGYKIGKRKAVSQDL